MADRGAVEEFGALVGGGQVREKRRIPGRKRVWAWQCSAREEVGRILEGLEAGGLFCKKDEVELTKKVLYSRQDPCQAYWRMKEMKHGKDG